MTPKELCQQLRERAELHRLKSAPINRETEARVLDRARLMIEELERQLSRVDHLIEFWSGGECESHEQFDEPLGEVLVETIRREACARHKSRAEEKP